MPLTGTAIRNAIKDIDTSKDFADALAKAIVDNLTITIPMQKVVTMVVGGSGTPAVGTKNTAPIKCKVK